MNIVLGRLIEKLDEEIVFVRTIARFLGISVDDAKEIIKKERKKQNGLE